jgi:zinc/manganese transport system ATP-binding protein/zinc transport system ATP-binding protein
MQALIELRNVRFGYGAKLVLSDINLHLHAGQFAALVGPSGAGKTTLLKLILGTLKPSSGEICIDGCVVDSSRQLQVGYVPQLETVDWNFPVTVSQVVLMGCTQGNPRWPWHTRADRQRMFQLLDQLELSGFHDRHIRDLSGGQQQRVFLARALISAPDLLVLDEPTAGVDIRTAEGVLHLLAHLNQSGKTILMTTHDLNAAAAHVPWVICLNQTIIAQGAPEDVFTVPTLNQTYRGDMMVIKQDGLLVIQEKPHHHTRHQVLPNPVPGHLP